MAVGWFSDLKIQKKLVLINIVTILFAIMPVVVAMFSYEYFAVRQAVLQEFRVQADIVSDNAAAAMAFNDADTAYEALSTLRAASDMQRATIFLPEGSVLASYGRDNMAANLLPFSALEKRAELLTWDRFQLQVPVFLKDNFVGALVIEAHLSTFYQRIQWYALAIVLAAAASFSLSLWAAIVLKRSITLPLERLMASVNQVTIKQDYSLRPDVNSRDEIGDLSRAFGNMMENLQERDDRLQDLAFYDEVTGLPNRNFFKERIQQVVGSALRYKRRSALMFIDLDDFKQVNDSLGHHVGDDLLHVVGLRLRTLLRNSDLVFRIGGDEFAVIVEHVEDDHVPTMLADKIIQAVSKPCQLRGQTVKVGASIGISFCPDHARDSSGFLKAADTAMYAAKSNVKNTYRVYSDNMEE